MNRYTYILDNGHGGVIDGVPQTPGKRSPDFGKGILYEGESNRILVEKLAKKLSEAGIKYHILVSELQDVSLAERVRRTNALAKLENCVLISIHSDAFTNGMANGWSCFTTKGETKSDKVATVMYKHAKNECLKLRVDYTDKDPDKEEDFYILRKTSCPAVLVENLFMTNKADYETLMSEYGQDKLVRAMFYAIKEIEENGI